MPIPIPMSAPDLTEVERTAINQVLDTSYLSMGPRLEAFERAMAEFVGTHHAVGVSSGTAGLHLAVIAAGVGHGDMVITTPFSFVASSNCILYQQGVPIFVDIDPETLNIDPNQVIQAVDALLEGGASAQDWLPPSVRDHKDNGSAARLKAILPIDVFGQPADYDPLRRVAEQSELALIEDACEAIGAEYRGRKAGTLGHVAVFAFYPNKQMTTGEGGIIVTDRDDWRTLFESLRNQGRDQSGTWLNHVRLGYNYRLDEMSAALGLAQLGRIDELLAKRERVARMYNRRLEAIDGVRIPHLAATTTRMSWFVYVIRLAAEIDRDRVMQYMHQQEIACRPYFTPIHLQPFYRERFGYRPGDFPVTEAVARSTLALPFHSNMDGETLDRVCAGLRRAISES